MAVNKNFVVKNGLEVNTNLILADAATNRVGIATTTPDYTLHVNGGIGATDSYVSAASTVVQTFHVGAGGSVFSVDALSAGIGSVGIGTGLPEYLLDVRSSVSTGQTALYVYGDMRVTGDINLDDITLDDATIQDLNITGLSTFAGYVDINNSVDLTGNLQVSGIGTIAQIHGDGSNITGLATGLNAAIGISSGSSFIGAGVTVLDFGTAGTTVSTPSAGVATVVTPVGASIGLVIALGG